VRSKSIPTWSSITLRTSHHTDHYLDKTPLEHKLWRYQTGKDAEGQQTNLRRGGQEDGKRLFDKRILDEILTRKKLKQSYEYEALAPCKHPVASWRTYQGWFGEGSFTPLCFMVSHTDCYFFAIIIKSWRPIHVRHSVSVSFIPLLDSFEPGFVSHNTMGGHRLK
jgi:elongation factor 3